MDKNRKGVALGYSQGDAAPRILAIARGALVESLLRLAEKYNITTYKDTDLAEILSGMKPGSEVPEQLYRAVAEVLAYCYKVNNSFKEKMAASGA